MINDNFHAAMRIRRFYRKAVNVKKYSGTYRKINRSIGGVSNRGICQLCM